MANTSILAAFERMWQHIVIALNNKSDKSHNHDGVYIQETSIVDNLTTTAKNKPLSANQGYILNQTVNGMKRSITNLQDDVDDLVDTAVTEEFVNQAIETAKTAVKNDLLNGAGEAYDTLKELGDLIDENQDAISALETIALTQADWNESDPTSPAYVKNKTHVNSMQLIKTERKELSIEESLTQGGDEGYYLLESNLPKDFKIENLKVMEVIHFNTYNNSYSNHIYGEVLLVSWGFNSYGIVVDGSYIAIYITQEALDSGSLDGMVDKPGLYFMFSSYDPEDPTAIKFFYSMEYEVGEFIQLDPSLVEGMYYDKTYNATLIDENNIVITEENLSDYYDLPHLKGLLNVDDTCIVTINGISEKCPIKYKWGALYLGNYNIVSSREEDTGEDFFIWMPEKGVIGGYVQFREPGTYNIKVEAKIENINKIDNKYLSLFDKKINAFVDEPECYSGFEIPLTNMQEPDILSGTYIISLNGNEHEVTFQADSNDYSWYDDGSIYIESYFDNYNLNSYVVYVDFYDDGTYSYDFKMYENAFIIKEQFIPGGTKNIAQVDWNVNDSEDPSYINNRTHYAYAGEEIFKMDAIDCSTLKTPSTDNESFYRGDIYNLDDSDNLFHFRRILSLNNYYYLKVNDIEYLCRFGSTGSDSAGITALAPDIWHAKGDKNHAPMPVTIEEGNAGGASILIVKEPGVYNISIHEALYQTLDERYIPNTISRMPDWNTDNSEDTSYIKNRTHYLVPGEAIFENINITSPTASGTDLCYRDVFNGERTVLYNTLTVGEKYFVKWDGVNYLCEFFHSGEGSGQRYILACADTTVMDEYGYAQTNYDHCPFVFSEYHTTNIDTNSKEDSHTFGIYKVVYNPLNEKYIPDSIARKADVYTKTEIDAVMPTIIIKNW